MHPIYCDIYFVLPSAFDILRYILSCRAIAIYDLPINLRYIYKRVSPLVRSLTVHKSASDLCKLCRGRQTTDHVLSICKVALDTGRFTWRHNCVINYIVNSIDDKYTVYSDLPGHTAPGGGSIPPELCVTSQKPDIVIIDNHMKAIHLYELTCPAERNIDTRNNEKSNKYAHFTTDITHLSCKVNCFEVSTKGFLNTRNHSTLNTLHKFVKPGITKTQFKSNISALSLTASYHIFLCKDEPTFMEPPFLLPPLVTKTKTVIAI